MRFESAIQVGTTHKCDQIGATHKCDQQVRLTSAINRCDSQVRSTGATHKCDRLNRESKKFASLQVFKFEKARKLASSQVCAQKTQESKKTLFE